MHFLLGFLLPLCSLTILGAAGQQTAPAQSTANEGMNASSYTGKVNIEPEMTPELRDLRKNLMYPYNKSDLTQIRASENLHDEPLPFRLPFFGFVFNYIWVHREGVITFNKGLKSYTFPLSLPTVPRPDSGEEDPSMIAPFFAFQEIPSDNRVPDAGVYIRVVNIDSEKNKTLRDMLILDFRGGMVGSHDFVPKYAIIITWRNMTHAGRRAASALRTNTYQAVIATDEIRTYAMFNYEQIEWMTHEDNFDGKKGNAAFVGFNGGNRTRFYEFRPYSQVPRVMDLTNIGFGNNHTGRFFFQINEELYPGSCIQKELDPLLSDHMQLTFFPRYGHMLGGTIVNVTGPCFSPHDVIKCTFEDQKVSGIYRDPNHATCVSPQTTYHGYVDLRVAINDRSHFLGRFYIQPPDIADDDVILPNEEDLRNCSSNQIQAVGVVFGDPHFITYDGWNYTFNGKGEYVLTRVDDAAHKLDIQGRFEQLPVTNKQPNPLGGPPKATLLTAVVARDNTSATVEFRVRPKAASWNYQMFVIVDQQYIFFWDESWRVQNFLGVTLYQPQGIKNMSHIIARFDSGPSVEVVTTEGYMTLRVYLPGTFKNKTEGLLGHYSDLIEDDFQLPQKRRGVNPKGVSREDIHRTFGRHWRLAKYETDIGESLFWHDPISFAEYDDRDFEPEFAPENLKRFQPGTTEYQEMENICGESQSCRYDYMLTLDKDFARVTKMHEAWGHQLQTNSKKPVTPCPAIAKPLNGQ